jgi:hypothetical protein
MTSSDLEITPIGQPSTPFIKSSDGDDSLRPVLFETDKFPVKPPLLAGEAAQVRTKDAKIISAVHPCTGYFTNCSEPVEIDINHG